MELAIGPALREPVLRDYQVQLIQDARALIKAGAKSLLLVLPTGGGKTIVAASILKRGLERNSRVLFLAHRRELIKQTYRKLCDFSLRNDTAILMAGEEMDGSMPVQVASIDTLRARAINRKSIPMPWAEIVFCDEAHRTASPTYEKVIAHYRAMGSVVIGLTATPCRTDGKGLGDLYERIVQGPSVAELTQQGHLVPVRYFAPSIPDLTGVRTTAGDYNALDLEKAMDRKVLVGDIVDNWARLGEGRPTIVFSAGVAHSMHIREEFESRGIRCAHIDASTPSDERDDIIARVERGDITVLTNCMVFNEGFDLPKLSCCVLARPTKSLLLFLQMAGRVLRPWPGKLDTIIIDHSGAVYRHGPVDEEREWSLDPGSKVQDREEKARELKQAKAITCLKCKCVYYSLPKCPECGWIPQRQPKAVEIQEGDLVAVDTGAKDDKRAFFLELRSIAEERGYKGGWAAYTYRARYGRWPMRRWESDAPATPTEATRGWVKHLQIKRAKEKARDAHRRGA